MKKILTYLILLAVFLSGCGGNDEGIPDIPAQIYEGKDGVLISLLPTAPPDKVSAGSAFTTAVLLENKGAINVSEDEIFVNLILELEKMNIASSSGFIQNTANPDFPEPHNILEGKETTLSGGRALLRYDVNVLNPFEANDFVNSNPTALLIATTCYAYETRLSTSVCIDTTPYESQITEREKVCEVETETYQNQGAPIAITKIEKDFIATNEHMVPNFRIYVKNVGGGVVINKAKLEDACQNPSSASSEISASCGGEYTRTVVCGDDEIKTCDENNNCRCVATTCSPQDDWPACDGANDCQDYEFWDETESVCSSQCYNTVTKCGEEFTVTGKCQDNQIAFDSNNDGIADTCRFAAGECSTSAFNIVSVKSANVSTKPLKCSPNIAIGVDDGNLLLSGSDEDNFFRCRPAGNEKGFPIAQGSAVTELDIELEYGYSSSATKTIIIERFI